MYSVSILLLGVSESNRKNVWGWIAGVVVFIVKQPPSPGENLSTSLRGDSVSKFYSSGV